MLISHICTFYFNITTEKYNKISLYTNITLHHVQVKNTKKMASRKGNESQQHDKKKLNTAHIS